MPKTTGPKKALTPAANLNGSNDKSLRLIIRVKVPEALG
jgi:hypothetical protein